MTSRNRKAPGNYNLQPSAVSTNGQTAGGSPAQAANRAPKSFESSRSQARPTAVRESPQGRIEVSPRAISHLASRAAQQVYGVVGLASRHARPGWAELLRPQEEHKGVEVSFTAEHIVIDLYVVIEYGTRISEVARNIMSGVKFAVESALDVESVQVNVNVQGIRVSS